MEINPSHPIIVELLERVTQGKTGEDTVELAHILYDTAALRAGYALRDQELLSFADRIERVVRENLGVDLYAEVRTSWSGAHGDVAVLTPRCVSPDL
jgi:heat shock protein 90kDa beta